jgi:hypothetical protein
MAPEVDSASTGGIGGNPVCATVMGRTFSRITHSGVDFPITIYIERRISAAPQKIRVAVGLARCKSD